MPTPRPSRRAVEPDNDDEDDFMPMPSKGKKAVDAVSWFHPSSHPPGTPEARKPTAVPNLTTPAELQEWAEGPVKAKRKLKNTIGIELTMMPPYLLGNSVKDNTKIRNVDGQIADAYGTLVNALLQSIRFSVCSAGDDQKAVEVASDILRTWGEVRTFYDTVTEVMLRVGLLPHVEHITSGGGHIHVGGLPTSLMAAAFRDIQNRPWLNWIFNDPDDTRSANSTVSGMDKITSRVRTACADATFDPSVFCSSLSTEAKSGLVFFGDIRNVRSNWLPSSKQNSLRFCDDYDTLEFRFFQAPANWIEQAAHLRFVEAYIEWLRHHHATHCPAPTELTEKQMRAWKHDDCVAQFKSFLTELGLPYLPYKRMVQENLSVRFERKTLT